MGFVKKADFYYGVLLSVLIKENVTPALLESNEKNRLNFKDGTEIAKINLNEFNKCIDLSQEVFKDCQRVSIKKKKGSPNLRIYGTKITFDDSVIINRKNIFDI
jgi:hypothetical protein